MPASEALRVQVLGAREPEDLLLLPIHLGGLQLPSLSDLLHFLLGQAQRYVLWLQISVNDLADPVQVV